ncbi:MAG: YaiI/YqxD family protein [Acidobacteriota bacterium]|jgi:uncharacterized protein YaiI (UPF0178 family)
MERTSPTIFVDADGCPVKEEVYRVARRHHLKVFVVSNSRMRGPGLDEVEPVVVEGGFDAADDWIVERTEEDDIVVSADIPLASRCIDKGCRVLDPRGRVYSEESIGEAVATRDLMAQLREMGNILGGPRPFEKKDRSRFLQSLEEVIRGILRRKD